MGLLGKLIKATIDTALLPVDVVLDVTVINPILHDEIKTPQRIKDIVKDLEEAGEDAGNGDFL
jgi:hypothetical protein